MSAWLEDAPWRDQVAQIEAEYVRARDAGECPDCHGEGEVPFNPIHPDPQGVDHHRCGTCGGSGLVEDE